MRLLSWEQAHPAGRKDHHRAAGSHPAHQSDSQPSGQASRPSGQARQPARQHKPMARPQASFVGICSPVGGRERPVCTWGGREARLSARSQLKDAGKLPYAYKLTHNGQVSERGVGWQASQPKRFQTPARQDARHCELRTSLPLAHSRALTDLRQLQGNRQKPAN